MPTCPPHYDCTFRLKSPPHYYEQWWDGPWGIAVAAAALVALVVVVYVIAYYWHEARESRLSIQAQERQSREEVAQRREEQAHKLAIEEQRTMQLDSAKGNPDMLKIVREMQQ